MKNPMADQNFLNQLFQYRSKVTYAKIISLTNEELPVEEISGKITAGSINIDGTSAVRRTCSLTINAQDVTLTDFYWTLSTKFKLEIGLLNEIDSSYPDIIWFPQGIYVISSFSASRATNNQTINIQGKDKMCLLNGEMGGMFNSSIDLGKKNEEEYIYTPTEISLTDFINSCKSLEVQNTSELPEAFPCFSTYETYELLPSEIVDKERVYQEQLYNLVDGKYKQAEAKNYNKQTDYYIKKFNVSSITTVSHPQLIYYNTSIYAMSVEGYEPTLITDIDAETYKKIEDVDMGEKGANWASGIFYLKFVDQNGKVHYYKDYATQWDEEKEYYQLVLPTYYEKEISIVTKNVPLKEIITELLYEYGGEPYYNIIINDLPEQGQELLEYRSQTPLYLVQNLENKQYQWYLDDTVEFPLVLDDEEIIYVYKSDVTKEDVETGNYYLETDDNEYTQTNVWYETGKYYKKVYNYQDNNRLALKDFTNDQLEFFKGLVKNENSATIDLREEDADERILGKVMKIEFGQTIGYRPTDLVYAGELVSNVGENVTTVLDKIKNMLGSFEYFYNLDGQFVFQAKPTFLNNSFSQFFKTEDTEFYDVKKQKYSYSFTDSKMFTTLSTAPNIANLKNNFTVWGERKGVTGNTLPMHMVYAIMEKPKRYKGFPITTGKKGNILLKNNKQCQYTFFTEDYPQLEEELKKYPYIEGDIYNECFVVDWRELIYQMAYDNSRYGTIGSDHFIQNYFLILRKNNPTLCNNDRGLTGYEPFYKDLLGFWRELYNPFLESEKSTHYLYDVEDYFNETSKYKWWTRNILYPELLNFWIDFLDTEGEIGKYSMKKIGNRPKNVNDTSVKGICFKEVPPIIFVEDYLPNPDPGYHYIKFNENYLDYFSISAQGKDAQTWINDAIYQNSIITESATITSMPIYYLQPNTIINVFNEDLKLDGEYIINRLSYSLSHNGTMSITALKNQPYIT